MSALKLKLCLLLSPTIGTPQLSIPSTLNALPEERAGPAVGTNCAGEGLQGSTPTSGSPLSAASLEKGNDTRAFLFTQRSQTRKVQKIKRTLTLLRDSSEKDESRSFFDSNYSLFSFACRKNYWNFITIPVI